MRIKVYPEGYGSREDTFNLSPAEAVKAYLREADDNDITNVCVEPLDDEARALPGWHAPDEPGGLPFKLYRAAAQVVVTWTVEEVATFNDSAKRYG